MLRLASRARFCGCVADSPTVPDADAKQAQEAYSLCLATNVLVLSDSDETADIVARAVMASCSAEEEAAARHPVCSTATGCKDDRSRRRETYEAVLNALVRNRMNVEPSTPEDVI